MSSTPMELAWQWHRQTDAAYKYSSHETQYHYSQYVKVHKGVYLFQSNLQWHMVLVTSISTVQMVEYWHSLQ